MQSVQPGLYSFIQNVRKMSAINLFCKFDDSLGLGVFIRKINLLSCVKTKQEKKLSHQYQMEIFKGCMNFFST